MQRVNLSRDATDNPSTLLGQEQLRFGTLKVRVLVRIEMLKPFKVERCHPARIIFVELKGKPKEGHFPASVVHDSDRNIVHFSIRMNEVQLLSLCGNAISRVPEWKSFSSAQQDVCCSHHSTSKPIVDNLTPYHPNSVYPRIKRSHTLEPAAYN